MGIICKKSGVLDDWYLIEKGEHAGVQRMVADGPNSAFLWCSSRISDADVEGSRAEMLAIADAILEHGSAHFKRCAVDAKGDEALFWSPRNSQMRGAVPIHEAAEMAMQIRRELAAGPPNGPAPEGGAK